MFRILRTNSKVSKVAWWMGRESRLVQAGQKSSWHNLAPLGALAAPIRALKPGDEGDPCDSGLCDICVSTI